MSAGDIGHPDRIHDGRGPGQQRLGRQLGATERQHDRAGNLGDNLAGKRLELLRELVPRFRRLAIMGNVSNHLTVLEMAEVRGAASTLGLDVATFEIRRRRISRRPLRRSIDPAARQRRVRLISDYQEKRWLQ